MHVEYMLLKKGMPNEQHFRRLDGDRQGQIACPPGVLRHTRLD